MITRAKIEGAVIGSNGTKYIVRIPIFDGIETNGASKVDLSEASVLCIPGIEVDYEPGDTVIVGFEDNNIGSPIILGYLKINSLTGRGTELISEYVDENSKVNIYAKSITTATLDSPESNFTSNELLN